MDLRISPGQPVHEYIDAAVIHMLLKRRLFAVLLILPFLLYTLCKCPGLLSRKKVYRTELVGLLQDFALCMERSYATIWCLERNYAGEAISFSGCDDHQTSADTSVSSNLIPYSLQHQLVQ
jgi:hypothetical protein